MSIPACTDTNTALLVILVLCRLCRQRWHRV